MVTRASQPKERMIRFVLAPNGQVVADLAARLPGRGMWLSAEADVIERASKRGAFAKATRGAAQVPSDLRERIEDGLRGRIGDLLGFARRAGQAVCGWQAVREWLQAGRVGLVVQAADGSASERARLIGARPVPVVAPLSAARLGALFGREHAVHVAIAPGRLADSIAAEAARLAGFLPAPTAAPAAALAGGEPAPLAGPEGTAGRDHPAPDDSRDGLN
jgi:predicted RNA-binding protein YlxR (DUF448 family)